IQKKFALQRWRSVLPQTPPRSPAGISCPARPAAHPSERRLAQPTLDRVAEDALGLLAHERELERHCVSLPDDSFDRLDQTEKTVLRGLGLAMSRLHTGQQSFTFSLHSLAFENFISQLFVDSCQLAGPFHDTLFELLAALPQRFVSLLQCIQERHH